MSDRTHRIGQQVGEYQLLRWLGGGSFGDVYLGEHVHTHSQAAIKILQTRLTEKDDLREFLNEARAIRLRHPHIIQLLDFGIGGDDVPFLVMEYAPNGTLRQRHPKNVRLPLSTVISYVTPIASALQYAHDHHLVHRDVKPDNILLGPNNELLLSDFGIASVAHSSHSINASEGVGGTLPYMAPEQFHGKPRPASDQYALAIVTYEWITGIRPFQGTPVEIAMQHSMTPPALLRQQVPMLPVDVEQVVLTALSKDPKQRFGSVQAFARALQQASQEGVTSNYIPNISTPSSSTPPSLPPSIGETPSETPFQTPVPPVMEQEYATPALFATPIPPPPPMYAEAASAPTQYDYGSPSTGLPIEIPLSPPLPTRKRLVPGKIMLLIIALLLIIGSASIAYTSITISNYHTQATATAQTIANKTATVQAIPTVTAQAQATTTAIVQATRTAAANAYSTMVSTKGIMYGFDAGHSGLNPYEQILNPTSVTGLTKAWSYPTSNIIFASPVVVDGVVYIGSYDNTFYALDATTGNKKWSFEAGNAFASSPAVVNGVVYVGNDDHNFYALDATTGTKKWAFQTGDFIASSPAVVNGVVYFGSYDHSIYALDAATGTKKWAFQTGSQIYSSPAVVDGVVYVGSEDHNFYALDAATGAKKWAFQGSAAFASSPAVVDGVVYVGSDDHNVYAFDAATGAKKWFFQTGNFVTSSPAVVNGTVYIGSDDRYLYALDAATGTKKWAYQTGGYISWSGPKVANGVVYVGSWDHSLYALDATNGTNRFSYATANNVDSSPMIVNGMVFFGSWDHNFYAFNLPNAS